jgi:hypothetical protein
MFKKLESKILAAAVILFGVLMFVPKIVFAQEPTTTPMSTIATTQSQTPSSTITITPTLTATPTLAPTVTQTPLPTPVSVDDIHSGFIDDFKKIDNQLIQIQSDVIRVYDQVYSPPGTFLVQNFISDFVYDMINPKPGTNATIYLVMKILGSLGLFFKATIVIVRVVKKDKQNSALDWVNKFFGIVIFVYALVFVMILYKPSVLKQPSTETPRTTYLSNIDNKLSDILKYVQAPASPVTNNSSINSGNVETQLASISNQLTTISTQDNESIIKLQKQLDDLQKKGQEVKSATAKSWLQVFSFIILIVILAMSLLRGDAKDIFRRFIQ